MRLFLLSTFLALASVSHCQGELPSKDGKVIYEIVDSSVAGSADELYSRAKVWMANAFRDAQEVIQLDDKEAHTLMGKGPLQFIQTMATYSVYFTVKIGTKDNKYRLQFYNIRTEVGTMRVTKTAESYNAKKGSDKMKKNINEGFMRLIESFKAALNKKTDSDF